MINGKMKTRALSLSLAAAIALPALAVFPAGDVSAAAAKYPIVSQAFQIEGTTSKIGTINKNSTTYIALRSLNNALGLKTNYKASSRNVEVTGKGRTMEIGLTNGSIRLNGQPVTGPEAIVQNQTTYLPLRFVLERLGYEVAYNNSSKVISLKAIAENNLTVTAKEIGADGNDKSLLVYYPVLSGLQNTEVQGKINAFLKQEADRFIAAGTKQMKPVVDENNKLLAKDPKATIRRPSFDGRYTVTYNEKGLLSLYTDYYVYLGGAHGDIVRAAYTFDLSTGDKLSLKQAANENSNYVSIINGQIKKQIAARKLPLQVPFNTIKPDRDFFLNHNGVVIYFTEYEYTSFAEGMPEFTIPYAAFTGN